MVGNTAFTNPIPQKIRRTKEYCGIPQNKGNEFHNIFKFCGTTPQIIPTHVSFDRSSILWKIDFAFASPFPLRISQIESGLFFVKFGCVNYAFSNTLVGYKDHTTSELQIRRKHPEFKK